MGITFEIIQRLLNEADIEGLLAVGAPMDEYESEASDIFEALQAMEPSDLSEDVVLAIVFAIWARSFELDAEEMERRREALKRVVRRLL